MILKTFLQKSHPQLWKAIVHYITDTVAILHEYDHTICIQTLMSLLREQRCKPGMDLIRFIISLFFGGGHESKEPKRAMTHVAMPGLNHVLHMLRILMVASAAKRYNGPELGYQEKLRWAFRRPFFYDCIFKAMASVSGGNGRLR